MATDKIRKYVLPNIPYLFIGWFCLKIGTAYRLAAGAGFGEKLLGLGQTIGVAFADFAPSLAPFDWLVGIVGAAAFRLLIYFKSKNAKKYRRDAEYGSARWGNEKDIKPFVDPKFENNMLLTATERLTMNTRPKNPANARNLNFCGIGSSGSGKTRFWLTPQLLQAHSSYVVVDPKGGVLGQVGAFLQKRGYTVSVNQATEAIWQTVPLVILGIFFMSILFSVIYSRYITKPIIELSSASQKMAQLDFEPHGNSNRSDEIGILSDSLNTLSDNLQHTLAELKKSNSELEAEISKERELEKKQQEFFSAASHELKTPLTILKGHLMGMLNKVKGYENQEAYMERSLAVVEKMETLVKELLYVSKTDGKQRSEYKTIDFAELLRVQIADVTDLLSEKEISLSVDIPDKILCEADPAQMERAIQNVLVNAIRYSPNGEAIYISLLNDKNAIFCKVENTGVHIPEEMIPHLFEAFYRADTSRNRNTGGTGLGLYIVRKIMELHRAKYGIKNTSRGVMFWLEMPQKRGAINSI